MRRYFFCGTVCSHGVQPQDLPVRKYGALCCPDFPYPRTSRDTIEQVATAAKVVNIWQKWIRTGEEMVIGYWEIGKWENLKIWGCGNLGMWGCGNLVMCNLRHLRNLGNIAN